MQARVNVSKSNSKRKGARHNRRISQLIKPLGGQMPKFLPTLLIGLVVAIGHGTAAAQTVSKPATPAAMQSDAQKAFEKMKTLAGSWHGTIMDISIDFTIRAASSGTAIVHEGNTDGGGPPNHEITMFYPEGDRLLATHYCDAGNRAHLEGKILPDGKTIEFSFLDVAGSTKGGLVKRMVLTLIDANHHGVEITFIMPNGKPIELRGDFQRTQ